MEDVLDQYGDPAEQATAELTDGDGPLETTDDANGNDADDDREGSDVEAAVSPSENGDTNTGSETVTSTQNETDGQDSSSANGSRGAGDIDPSTLSERERETLRAIARRPTVSQAEIADELGVSRATVSKRVSKIPGFEWRDRREFVEEVLPDEFGEGDQPAESASRARSYSESVAASEADSDFHGEKQPGSPDEANSENDVPIDSQAVTELRDRVAALENRLDGNDETELSAELAAKVAHACLDAEYISKAEELAILEHVLERGR